MSHKAPLDRHPPYVGGWSFRGEPMLVGGAEGRDVRFRENEQRSQASDLGAKPPVSSGAERPVLGSPDKWWSRRSGSIAAKLDWVSTLGALRLDDRGSTQMQLALIPSFAGKAIHHPSDACRHARVRFGALFLVFAHDPTGQGDPSTVDADLDAVARNGEIPMQRRHDGEFDALVASPLPIVVVVCSKLELRGTRGLGRQSERWPRLLVRKTLPQKLLNLPETLSNCISSISPTVGVSRCSQRKG